MKENIQIITPTEFKSEAKHKTHGGKDHCCLYKLGMGAVHVLVRTTPIVFLVRKKTLMYGMEKEERQAIRKETTDLWENGGKKQRK